MKYEGVKGVRHIADEADIIIYTSQYGIEQWRKIMKELWDSAKINKDGTRTINFYGTKGE
jgi:hypothetical protein